MVKHQKSDDKPGDKYGDKSGAKFPGPASKTVRFKPEEEAKHGEEPFHMINCSTGEDSNLQDRPTISFNAT